MFVKIYHIPLLYCYVNYCTVDIFRCALPPVANFMGAFAIPCSALSVPPLTFQSKILDTVASCPR